MSTIRTRYGVSKQKGRAVLRPALRAGMIVMALVGLVLVSQGLWIHAKAMVAQVLLDRAFTRSVATGQPVKPRSWADTWPVARLEFPRIGETSIVLHGASGQALAFGPGHVDRSAEAGDSGTAVYAAHRDTHFAFLKDVQIGDTVRITRRDGKVFTYQVTETSVVRWDQSGIDANAAGRNLVLATCWPFDAATSGPMRYLVKARMLE